jgi:hypothetical protein
VSKRVSMAEDCPPQCDPLGSTPAENSPGQSGMATSVRHTSEYPSHRIYQHLVTLNIMRCRNIDNAYVGSWLPNDGV